MFARLSSVVVVTAIAAAIGAVVPASAKPFHGANLLPQATVKLAAARTTALAARPGKVTDEELEAEAGGSGLRY